MAGSAPDMPALIEFCRVEVDLERKPIGPTGRGRRVDVEFTGTATSSHWEGAAAVSGIDYITIGEGGLLFLDVHARIDPDDGNGSITYHGLGRSGSVPLREAVTFESGREDLAWLNAAVGFGAARLSEDQTHLSVVIWTIQPDG